MAAASKSSASPQSPAPRRRATSLAEDAAEGLIEARKTYIEAKKSSKRRSIKDRLNEIGREFYNSEYREFLSRDAKSWFKLSVFYCLYFLFMAGFFSLLLYIFYLTIDPVKPTYYNKESVMDYKKVNPGLGFRPQVDPEGELVKVDNTDPRELNDKYLSLFKLFLEKYEDNRNKSFPGYKNTNVTFDYRQVIDGTPCAVEQNFGFTANTPCVAVKLNRIYGWMPRSIPYSALPFNQKEEPTETEPKKKTKTVVPAPTVDEEDEEAAARQKRQVADHQSTTGGNSTKPYVYVLCDGETSADKDNVGKIDYYSTYPGREVGGIHLKYYPYQNQPDYLSPLVFVHFKSVARNTLVNVECKAYAQNIDNQDRSNRRGMVRFQLYVVDKDDAPARK